MSASERPVLALLVYSTQQSTHILPLSLLPGTHHCSGAHGGCSGARSLHILGCSSVCSSSPMQQDSQ